MKKLLLAGVILLVSAASASAGDFSVSSPQFEDGGRLGLEQVLNGFGCAGSNISPELNWQGEPAGTKSFAVTVYDPDAPTGSGWWHWVLFNIPATTHQLPAGSGSVKDLTINSGVVQSRTDFGAPGYGGACPPKGHGDHKYQFQVWALDIEKIDLEADASAALVGYFLHQHQLGKAEVTAYYGRK